jgi:ribosome-binding factor A
MRYRKEKISSLIQRELNNIILKEIEVPGNSLITLTEVKINDDFKKVDVFVSIFPLKEAEKVFKILIKKSKYFGYLLKQRLGIRQILKLNFLLDLTDKVKDLNI